jgi:anti-anti-sigma factor
MLNVHAKRLGSVAVLGLQGQIVNGQTEILRNAVSMLSGISAVKLDLAGVTMIDAGGLGVMLALREQSESKGIRFELMNVNKRINMVLALTHLDSVFRITNRAESSPAISRARPMVLAPIASCA